MVVALLWLNPVLHFEDYELVAAHTHRLQNDPLYCLSEVPVSCSCNIRHINAGVLGLIVIYS